MAKDRDKPSLDPNVTLATVLGDVVIALSCLSRGHGNTKYCLDAIERIEAQRKIVVADVGDEPKDVVAKDGKPVHPLRKESK